MKKLFFIIIIIAGGLSSMGAINGNSGKFAALTEFLQPDFKIIKNPVYMLARSRVNYSSHQELNVEMFILGKMLNETDCRQNLNYVVEGFLSHDDEQRSHKLIQNECVTSLPTRYANLFENRPTHITYLSVARGNYKERDLRAIVWGFSTEKSETMMCDLAHRLQNKYQGKVECIQPVN